MADPNDGQTIASAWEAVVGKTPADQIHDDYWLLNQLSEGEGFKAVEGRTITGPIEYALNSSVSSYSDLETLDTTRYDVFDQFEFVWKEYAGTVVHSELEKAKNQGSGRKFDLLAAKLENLKNSFKSVINTDLFSAGTANDSKGIGGLQHIVSSTPTTGTVGGINRAVFTFWRNQQEASAGSSFNQLLADMALIYNACSNGVSGEHPGFAVTTQTVFQGYEGLLVSNERIWRESASDKGMTRFKSKALMFKDIPVSYDNDCLASTMYLLNTKYLKLAYVPGFWMKGFPAVDPANQTADIFKVMTICNLITTNPRRLGVVTAIS